MKFATLLMMAGAVTAEESKWTPQEKLDGANGYLESDERLKDYADSDKAYLGLRETYEKMLTNGIPVDWCAEEDKKRHVVASKPGVTVVVSPGCVADFWPNASIWIKHTAK